MAENINNIHEEEAEGIVTMVNEDGEKHDFLHLDSFESNGKIYVVLLPADEGDEDCEDVLIYTLFVEEDGSETLMPIDDEKELDDAFEEFKTRMADEYDFE